MDFTQWLDTLYKIAIDIHPHAVTVEDEPREDPQDRDWFQEAINHPSGKLAEFWVYSINKWREQQAVPPQALNTEYRQALDTMIQDNGIPGKLGRTVLVRYFNFLYFVDSAWSKQHLLPLFYVGHKDFACAWDGYLSNVQLFIQIIELLQNELIDALQRAIQEFPQNRLSCLVQFYVVTLSCLIQDANDKWIVNFFEYAQKNVELKCEFTEQVGLLLRNLEKSQQREWWNIWLKDYWKNRLKGVPCPLEDRETAEMFEWVVRLQRVFPEAVVMAMQMEPVILKDDSSLLREIGKSNLINRHPNKLAKFLIYCGNQEKLPEFWKSDRNVIEKLLQKNLPENLSQGLQELIARL